MSYDLYAPGHRAMHFTPGEWPVLLFLAYLYGWEPSGTAPPDDWGRAEGPWPQAYLTNDHQRVEDEDAERLAAALERALPELPDHPAPEPGPPPACGDGPLNPLERFSGAEKEVVRRFVRFCREGGFRIG